MNSRNNFRDYLLILEMLNFPTSTRGLPRGSRGTKRQRPNGKLNLIPGIVDWCDVGWRGGIKLLDGHEQTSWHDFHMDHAWMLPDSQIQTVLYTRIVVLRRITAGKVPHPPPISENRARSKNYTSIISWMRKLYWMKRTYITWTNAFVKQWRMEGFTRLRIMSVLARK